MKTTLGEIEKVFLPLNDLQKSAIKGGEGIKLSDDQLKQLFDYSAAGGFNSTTSQAFNFAIRRMVSTDAGASLVRSLTNYTNSKINLSNTDPIPGAAAQYVASTNTLTIGNISSFSQVDPIKNAKTLNEVSHEMYHAFQDLFFGTLGNNTATNTPVMIELDPQLFSAKVLKQFDSLTGNNYYSLTGYGQILKNPGFTENPAFVAAWNDILNNSNLTLANYNTLVAGFKSSNMGNTPLYNYLDASLITDSSQLSIQQLLFNTGQIIIKYVPGGDPIITPVGGSGEDPYGVNWNDSSPFGNPFEWGYDPGAGSFGFWYEFNTTNYTGETMAEMDGGAQGGDYGGGRYTNMTGYVEEWWSVSDQRWLYLSPGETALPGYEFIMSQDPNNPGGFDDVGCNPNGFGTDGRDANGFDKQGFDENGLDRFGFDENGWDAQGYDEDGYDTLGYDGEGYDKEGYDEYGYTREENGDY